MSVLGRVTIGKFFVVGFVSVLNVTDWNMSGSDHVTSWQYFCCRVRSEFECYGLKCVGFCSDLNVTDWNVSRWIRVECYGLKSVGFGSGNQVGLANFVVAGFGSSFGLILSRILRFGYEYTRPMQNFKKKRLNLCLWIHKIRISLLEKELITKHYPHENMISQCYMFQFTY